MVLREWQEIWIGHVFRWSAHGLCERQTNRPRSFCSRWQASYTEGMTQKHMTLLPINMCIAFLAMLYYHRDPVIGMAWILAGVIVWDVYGIFTWRG